MRILNLSDAAFALRAQESGGKFIQEHGRVRVLAQNGCGRHGTDRAFEAGLYRLRFSRIRNYDKNLFRFQYLPNSHGYRPRGNLRKRGEPTLSYLLEAAGLIEVNNDARFLGVEIRRGVIEGEMAIFADTYEGDVDRSSRQLCGDFANSFRNISFAIKKVVLGDCRFMNQTFEKVFAKAVRKRSRQPNVFVEVKHFDARPLDAGHRRQGIQKFEL